jgi:hypothetical protein
MNHYVPNNKHHSEGIFDSQRGLRTSTAYPASTETTALAETPILFYLNRRTVRADFSLNRWIRTFLVVLG